LLIAQLSGSIAASALALGVFRTLDPVRTEPAVGVSIPRGLFIEAILTAQLVLVILLFAREKQKATVATPIVIGLALLTSELVAIFWTGGSLNPARSFGPNVVSWTWASTHWIYWAGPLLGSVIAVILLRVLQALTLELRTEDEYDGHFSPPCQHPPRFEQPNAMARHDFKGLRLDIPRGAFSPVVSSDLTGVINLWQTRPGGRFRGNSIAHASNAPQIGRGTGEG
jgi:aquaporin related protein